VGGLEIADFGFAIGPAVVVGLVVRHLVIAGDAADQTRLVFVDLVAVGIVVAVHAIPDTFVFGEVGHVLLQIGHVLSLGVVIDGRRAWRLTGREVRPLLLPSARP